MNTFINTLKYNKIIYKYVHILGNALGKRMGEKHGRETVNTSLVLVTTLSK